MARISLDTPYFVREADALSIDTPVYPLIIGNIPGARDVADPDIK